MRSSWLVVLILSVFMVGCASQHDRNEMTESVFYQKAHQQLVKKRFNTAIDDLKELKARFPYSEYAEQAQLDLVYAYYQTADFAEAIAAAKYYLDHYPSSEQIDYVLYFQGLSNFRLTESAFERIIKRNIAARDLTNKRDAFNDFAELVERFPDSQYAPDARSRMVYIRHLMAQENLEAARYYAKREAFVSAVARAQRVVEHYQGTPSVEEALAIMSRSYRALGQSELADKSRQVLAHNWPKSAYLNSARDRVEISWWPQEKTWLQLLTFDLL